MKQSTKAFCLGLMAFGFLVARNAHASMALYGVTRPNADGEFSLVKVDTNTGLASQLKGFNGGAAKQGMLAYYDPTGDFLSIRATPLDPALVILNPLTGTAVVHPITGLPAGETKTSGLTYQASQNRILITFGQDGTSYEDRIAEINLDGTVLNTSPALSIGDRDTLGEDPATGNLLAVDLNGDEPRMAIIGDVFGTPVISEFANPTFDSSLIDLAISPDSARVFTARVIGPTELVEINIGDNTLSTIGNFGMEVAGLTFAPDIFVVPEPSAFVLVWVGAFSILAVLRVHIARRNALSRFGLGPRSSTRRWLRTRSTPRFVR